MKKWASIVGLLALGLAVWSFIQWRRAENAASAAQLRAAQAERAAEIADSIYQHNADSIAQLSKAQNDSIRALEESASAARRRLQALSHSIDSLVALGPGQVIELPPDATALDSAKAVGVFWKARYEERTEAQRLAMQEADSLRSANLILHRQVFDGRRLLAQADSTIQAWKASSELWKAAAQCRVPLLGAPCPSRTVVGVVSAGVALVVSR